MYRRVVSIFLLPCVLLAQSAALGHAHSGSQPAGHDLRPHFHTNRISYSCGGGSHHHHDDGDDLPEPDTQPTPQPEPLSDHDEDAVYVAVDTVVSGRVQAGDDDTRCQVWLLPALNLLAAPYGLGEPPNSWTHPPPLLPASDCPLYLRQLTLLI